MLLQDYFREEAVELVVAHLYLCAAPYLPPGWESYKGGGARSRAGSTVAMAAASVIGRIEEALNLTVVIFYFTDIFCIIQLN